MKKIIIVRPAIIIMMTVTSVAYASESETVILYKRCSMCNCAQLI